MSANTIASVLFFLGYLVVVSYVLLMLGSTIREVVKKLGKWREARRLVRQAEATEAMKRYRAEQALFDELQTGILRDMDQLNDLIGGKK